MKIVQCEFLFEGSQIYVDLIFGQFAFGSDTVEHILPKNGHGILCEDDIITVMNEAININSVNQHHPVSIKYFAVKFHFEYIKYDHISITNQMVDKEREIR